MQGRLEMSRRRPQGQRSLQPDHVSPASPGAIHLKFPSNCADNRNVFSLIGECVVPYSNRGVHSNMGVYSNRGECVVELTGENVVKN